MRMKRIKENKWKESRVEILVHSVSYSTQLGGVVKVNDNPIPNRSRLDCRVLLVFASSFLADTELPGFHTKWSKSLPLDDPTISSFHFFNPFLPCSLLFMFFILYHIILYQSSCYFVNLYTSLFCNIIIFS